MQIVFTTAARDFAFSHSLGRLPPAGSGEPFRIERPVVSESGPFPSSIQDAELLAIKALLAIQRPLCTGDLNRSFAPDDRQSTMKITTRR